MMKLLQVYYLYLGPSSYNNIDNYKNFDKYKKKNL